MPKAKKKDAKTGESQELEGANDSPQWVPIGELANRLADRHQAQQEMVCEGDQ